MISNSAGVFVQRTALVKLGTRTRLHSLPKVGIPFRKFGTNVEPYERRRRWPPRSIAELALVHCAAAGMVQHRRVHVWRGIGMGARRNKTTRIQISK